MADGWEERGGAWAGGHAEGVAELACADEEGGSGDVADDDAAADVLDEVGEAEEGGGGEDDAGHEDDERAWGGGGAGGGDRGEQHEGCGVGGAEDGESGGAEEGPDDGGDAGAEDAGGVVGEPGDHGEGHALGDGEEGDIEAGCGVAFDGSGVGCGEVLLEGKPIPARGVGIGIGSRHGDDGGRSALHLE